MAVSLNVINGYAVFTSVSEHITAFYAARLNCIIGSRNWVIYLIFFLTTLKKHFNIVS